MDNYLKKLQLNEHPYHNHNIEEEKNICLKFRFKINCISNFMDFNIKTCNCSYILMKKSIILKKGKRERHIRPLEMMKYENWFTKLF